MQNKKMTRPATFQPFTVMLMLPDDMRGDECCAADWIRREWVWGASSTEAGVAVMIDMARMQLAEAFEWYELYAGDDGEELQQRIDSLEPVAVYAGHVFDIYQP